LGSAWRRALPSDIRSLISSSIDMVSASTSWRERAHGIYPVRFCRTNNNSCERNNHGAVAILPSMNSTALQKKWKCSSWYPALLSLLS
jgi:hypothetical protein